ncbi:MAG: hypothetical protein ACRERU_12130 [Methylococcales bacterium]
MVIKKGVFVGSILIIAILTGCSASSVKDQGSAVSNSSLENRDFGHVPTKHAVRDSGDSKQAPVLAPQKIPTVDTNSEPLKEFTIKDSRLIEEECPPVCHTQTEIKAVPGGYETGGAVHYDGKGARIFCPPARHTWIGRSVDIANGAILEITSSDDAPLVFEVDATKGYLYVEGRGQVRLNDGSLINLPTDLIEHKKPEPVKEAKQTKRRVPKK